MNSIRQTYRRRMRAVFGILLMLLSGILPGLAYGQYVSAQDTLDRLHHDFSLLAAPNERDIFRYEYTNQGGEKVRVRSAYFPLAQEVREFVAALPQEAPELVAGFSNSSLITAYCPEATPQIVPLDVTAYNRASFSSPSSAFELTSTPYLGEDNRHSACLLEVQIRKNKLGGVFGTVGGHTIVEYRGTGIVTDVISLPEGYSDPTGREIELWFYFRWDEYQAADLEPGGRYLVQGVYSDLDQEARLEICNQSDGVIAPEDVDWSNLHKYVDPSGSDFMEGFYEYADEIDIHMEDDKRPEDHPTKRYIRAYLEPDEVAQVGKARISNVQPDGTHYCAKIPQGKTAEDLLKEEKWQKALTLTEYSQHSFPVLAAENINYMVLFSKNQVMIAEGRDFTQEEYTTGTPVCLISESMAKVNGLALGDSISMELYPMDPSLKDPNWVMTDPAHAIRFCTNGSESASNPQTYDYDPADPGRQQQSYTIVGFYRQDNEWSGEFGYFTLNTILVPEKSVTVTGREEIDGCLGTLKVRRGQEEALKEYLKTNRYTGLFEFLDRDYSSISESVKGYAGISEKVLLLGAGLWLLILVLFMLLFPAQEGKNLNRMWALGAEKKQLMGHVLLSGGSILLPGAALGFIGSALAAEKFGQIVADFARSEEPLKISISSLAAASAVSFLVQLLILTVIAFFMSRKRREDF